MIALPEAALGSPEQAVRHYATAGLKPVLIHAPVFTEGAALPSCTCGKAHEGSQESPWGSTGKHPIGKHWQKYAGLDATLNQLARLRFVPNVGLILGEQPAGGYVVAVDVDQLDRLRSLETEHGELPPTLQCDSGRGYRLFYELGHEVAPERAKNVNGMGGAPGLDVKVDGGQVVVAPSMHPSGKAYAWSRWGGIELLPAAWALALWPNDAPAPAWSTRAYVPKDAREAAGLPKRKRAYLEKIVREDSRLITACAAGGRNAALFGRALRAFSLAIELDLGTSHQGWIQAELWNACTAWGAFDTKKTIDTILRALAYAKEKAIPGSFTMPAPRARLTLVQGGGAAPPSSTFESTEPPSLVTETDGATALSPDAFAAALGANLPSSPASFQNLAALVSGDPLERIVLTMDRGQPSKIASNAALLFAEHPAWNGGPRFDAYSHQFVWPLPLPEPIRRSCRAEREFVDTDYGHAQGWLMSLPESHRVRLSREEIRAALHIAATEHHTDLLREWVLALPAWDGRPRIDTWTVDYLGMVDSPYARATGKAWLIACAERALTPGVSVDVIPVLEAKQGSGKNRALEILFEGGPSWAPWYTVISGFKLDKDETKRLACSRWILHDDELRGADARRVDDLKSWASRTREEYRVPYAKEITNAPRRALLIGSTNRQNYLHDPTGNRRWYPWATHNLRTDLLARDRLQLLSEAVQAARGGAKWRDGITDELYQTTLEESEDRRLVDPLTESLEIGLRQKSFPEPLTTRGIALALGFPVEKIDRAFEMRLSEAMKSLGYSKVRHLESDGSRTRAFERDVFSQPAQPAQPRSGSQDEVGQP